MQHHTTFHKVSADPFGVIRRVGSLCFPCPSCCPPLGALPTARGYPTPPVEELWSWCRASFWGSGETKIIFCQKFCPRQRSCPGQVASSKKKICQKFCPRQRRCLGQVAWSKNRNSEKKICPMQRSCPGQVVSSNKLDFLEKTKICPRQ